MQVLALALACLSSVPQEPARDGELKPNVVIVFADDQGYGDLSCYGHPTIHTPHVDRLAANGAKLTQFYVGSPVCSPSRAALLTGCYPKRIGMHRHVVFPENDWGLNPDEVTIAEILRDAGYATGCFGKWHLGHRAGLMPTDQGFDVFAGVPYSNDMAQIHRKPDTKYRFRLPWIEGTKVVEWEPDQRLLTKRQTDAAVAFIEENAAKPFFAYVPYSMPHIPIYASDEYAGKSRRGLYGDVIEEIDGGVGRIVDALERIGRLDDTIVIFTSDNGPWLPYGLEGGSAGLLRGGKGTNWEGGQRVPCVVHWPARIEGGTVAQDLVTAMDVLPTIAAIAGVSLPDRKIDGRNVLGILLGGRAKEPGTFVYYTSKGDLAGVRRGPWKYLIDGGKLFHVEHDVGEKTNVAEKNPDVVRRLSVLARELDAAIQEDSRTRGVSQETLFDPARR